MEFKICIGLAIFTHLLFIIVFQVLKYYPPKEINFFYGYRTKASMKNKENWIFANKIAPVIFIKNMGIGLFIQILLQIVISNFFCIEVCLLLIMIEIFLCLGISFLLIERKLKTNK